MRRLFLSLLFLLPALSVTAAEEHKTSFALKANLLSAAALIPDLGAEVSLDGRWSVSGDWHYAWWSNSSKNYFRQTYGGGLVLRKWFSKNNRKDSTPRGHHIGIYARVFSYDSENGGPGQMGALPGGTLWDRCCWGAGLEYGHSFRLAEKLNLDISIGMGYTGGQYITYEPSDGHYVWRETSNRNWVGPGKAEISIVWLLGRDNHNSKRRK